MSNDHASPAELRGLPRASYARSHEMPEFWLDTSLPPTCEWCYQDIDPATGDCVHECYEGDRYWSSLTPAEQEAELAMMDDYASWHQVDV